MILNKFRCFSYTAAFLIGSAVLLTGKPAFAKAKAKQVKSSTGWIESYRKQTQKLVEDAKDQKVSPESLVIQAKKLVAVSKPIVRNFALAHVECKDYLEAVLDNVNLMYSLTEEKIEASFHKDGALPKSADACYHAKDLVVHPATVVVLAQAKGKLKRIAMSNEMQETLAHLAVVEQQINQK